jgi:hypothetical protein
MPKDRTLSIMCTFVGFYRPSDGGYGGSMTYTQLLDGTDPAMPGIVDTTGSINVWKAPAFDPKAYNPEVDITLSLDPASYCALQDSTRVGVQWASTITNNPNDLTAMLLLDGPPPGGQPLSPSKASAGWAPGYNGTRILINDKDESANYYFRPAIVVPSLNNYYISCDPPLMNRAGT